MNELGGLAIGFVFGIGFGALFFELFSVKHPKTREEAEQLLALLPEPPRSGGGNGMRVIEKRRRMPDYDSEYVDDEAMTAEVERLAMSPALVASRVEDKPGAFIEQYGKRFRLDKMKSKHFQSGKYRSK